MFLRRGGDKTHNTFDFLDIVVSNFNERDETLRILFIRLLSVGNTDALPPRNKNNSIRLHNSPAFDMIILRKYYYWVGIINE